MFGKNQIDPKVLNDLCETFGDTIILGYICPNLEIWYKMDLKNPQLKAYKANIRNSFDVFKLVKLKKHKGRYHATFRNRLYKATLRFDAEPNIMGYMADILITNRWIPSKEGYGLDHIDSWYGPIVHDAM